MSVTGLCGGLGSGKTLRLSALLFEEYKKGRKVFCNYNLEFPHTLVNPLDLINGLFDDELNDSACGFTEAYTFLDSRYSGSESNRYITYFLLQSRKRKVKFYYDAQMIGSVDVRLRGITNTIYNCKKILKDYNKDREEIDNIIGFVYDVYQDDGTNWIETLSIDDALKYFKIYNTRDILLPQYLQPQASFDDIVETFENSGTRDIFISMIRVKNPFMNYEKCRAIYTLLKNDKVDEVKQLLRIS